ncbi:hypothetical protein [Chrysiogenes arsenatis]|uniref:hypothetical protein n=1 Tax=Chrysiogenes arsenatis TaxID=309797 RepID=UPI0003F5051E|nr:hypothetical protein [Chrysiogenes arsenatis]
MKVTPIFRGSDGLDVVVDPVRLKFDPDNGVSSLAVAVNVVVDRTGRVSRRDGYSEVITGDCHSVFCDGGICLFVRDNELCRLHDDMSVSVVRSGVLAGTRCDYAQVNNDIYVVGGIQGIVNEHGEFREWEAGTYVGAPTTRSFSAPPESGEHVAFFQSRVFVSVGNVVFYSEPFGFSLFDMERGFFMFPTRIRMLKPVNGGLYVSTETETIFISGANANEWQAVKVAAHPALEWSAAIDLVDGLDAGLEEPGLCALWASREGACLGTPSGVVVNLNRHRILYGEEAGVAGASILRGFNFIQTVGI